MATEYMEKRDAILKDRSASDWLKNALFSLERRDPCDALGDVEALLELEKLRLEGTLTASGNQPRIGFRNMLARGAMSVANPHHHVTIDVSAHDGGTMVFWRFANDRIEILDVVRHVDPDVIDLKRNPDGSYGEKRK